MELTEQTAKGYVVMQRRRQNEAARLHGLDDYLYGEW